MVHTNDIRWKQRFANFAQMFLVFQRRIDEYQLYPNQEAYQMALIQAFEIIIELAWKTLKDYLENQGYYEVKNGKHAIRQAAQDNLIETPEIWMMALELRNETSHVYNPAIMNKVIHFLADSFYIALKNLEQTLRKYL